MKRVLSAIFLLLAPLLLGGFTRGGSYSSVVLPPWTTYTPTGNIIYVSTSGSDANTCTAAPPVNNSFATPCATLAHALSLVTSGNGDWVLLKAGDTFVNTSFGNIAKSGASCNSPLLFSSYGSGARPIIEVTSSNAPGLGGTNGGGADYIAVQGLEFYAYQRDPANGSFSTSEMTANYAGLSFRGPMHCHDVENNFVHFFGTDLEYENDGAAIAASAYTFTGNIITDAYSTGGFNNTTGHSQGLHAINALSGTTTYNLSFNLFDNNGWNGTLAGPWTASMTCASPSVVTATGIHVVNGSAITFSGTPCTGFSAGTVYCVINLSGSTFNLTAAAAGPVCPNGSTTLNGTGTSSGLSVTYLDPQATQFNRNMYIANGVPVVAQYNISSNSSAEGAEFRAGGTVQHNLFFQDSDGFDIGGRDPGTPLVTSWTGGGNVIQSSGDIVQGTGNQPRAQGINVINASGLTITSELISHAAGSLTNQIGVTLNSDLAGVNNTSVTGNTICAWNTQTFDQSGGTGNVISPNFGVAANCTSSGFLDGTRTAASYDGTVLGGPGTYADFIAKARGQSKANWNPAYAAPATVSWIRQGYNLN